jgi:hypothetical protein
MRLIPRKKTFLVASIALIISFSSLITAHTVSPPQPHSLFHIAYKMNLALVMMLCKLQSPLRPRRKTMH